MTTFLHTEVNYVFHLERDLSIPGNILFSDGSAMKTTDFSSTSLIAGSATQYGYVEGVGSQARFNFILSFLQLSTNQALIADNRNHCLRSLNRATNQTGRYAGNCTHEGNQNGVNALLNEPMSLINDLKNPGHVLISEWGGIIKKMNTTNRNVSYFGTVGRMVYNIIQSLETGDFFVTVSHAVGIFSYQMKTFTVIFGSTSRGFHDGPFSEVQFHDPFALLFLNNHTILVSDHYNNRLRVLDLITNSSSSICSGEEGHADGNFSSCTIQRPLGLLTLTDTVYIGSYGKIRRIEGKFG